MPFRPSREGIFDHRCQQNGCLAIVQYDDEPKCYAHSPESGSSVRGYSARRVAQERQWTIDCFTATTA